MLYRDGVNIHEDIIEYVAKNIKTNIRELEGAIISLIAQSSFNKAEITLETIFFNFFLFNFLIPLLFESNKVKKIFLFLN